MTSISDLSTLFTDTTLVSEFDDGETIKYTLLANLTISVNSLSPAVITTVRNFLFDGDGLTITYVDENDNVATDVYSNGIFSTGDYDSNGYEIDITIKNLGVLGGQINARSGFICSEGFGQSSSSTIAISDVTVPEK